MQLFLNHKICTESKRPVPVTLNDIQMFETLSLQYRIRPIHFTEVVNDDVLIKILSGEKVVTPEQFLALYARLEYEVHKQVSYNMVVVSPVVVASPKVAMLKMMNCKLLCPATAPVVCIDDKEGGEETEEEVEEVVVPMTRTVDKADPKTYTEQAKAYVAENYDRRVHDVMVILKVFKLACGVTEILAPNDGAGVAYAACSKLGIVCHSADPSPAMVAEATAKGNKVALGDARSLLGTYSKGVVFVSHSETLDPGVVAMSLMMKRAVIAYETVEVYPGYSHLNDNDMYVRSTFDISIPFLVSRAPYPEKYSAWFDITKHSTSFYISDHKVIEHLLFLKSVDVAFEVSTKSISVLEKCTKYGVPVVKYSSKHLAVYVDKCDIVGHHYFNLRYGIYHLHPGVYMDVKDIKFVYGSRLGQPIVIGTSQYGVFTGMFKGRDEKGNEHLVSSIHPNLQDCVRVNAVHTLLEVLHEKCQRYQAITSLTEYEQQLALSTPKYFQIDAAKVISKHEWLPDPSVVTGNQKFDQVVAQVDPFSRGRTWKRGLEHMSDGFVFKVEPDKIGGKITVSGIEVDMFSIFKKCYSPVDDVLPSPVLDLCHVVLTSATAHYQCLGLHKYKWHNEDIHIEGSDLSFLGYTIRTLYPEFLLHYFKGFIRTYGSTGRYDSKGLGRYPAGMQ